MRGPQTLYLHWHLPSCALQDFDPRTTSILLSVILEGIFLLLFVVTYIFGSWVTLRSIPTGGLRRPSTALFVAGTAMFLLAVAVGWHNRVAVSSMLILS